MPAKMGAEAIPDSRPFRDACKREISLLVRDYIRAFIVSVRSNFFLFPFTICLYTNTNSFIFFNRRKLPYAAFVAGRPAS